MRTPRLITGVVAAVAVAALSGCVPSSVKASQAPGATAAATATQSAVSAPVVTANVPQGGKVAPGTAVTLTTDKGRLASVVLRDETAGVQIADLGGATGATPPTASSSASPSATASPSVTASPSASTSQAKSGVLSADGRNWRSAATLTPGHSLSVSAVASLDGGPSTTLTRTFAVAPPKTILKTDVLPSGTQIVGVGYPIIVKFSTPVTNKAAVERALVVETSKPIGAASWSWYNSKEIHFRPKQFWPANTTVVVHLNLAGVQAGSATWGMKNRDVTFQVGRSQILTINAKTDRGVVTRNGKVIKKVPVSLGRPGFRSRSGIKVVMTKERKHKMDSQTVNITGPDAYNLIVEYALRLTNSGEFLHAAPWNGNIGHANTSHGCSNLHMSDAKWFYKAALIGDPVVTSGTGRQMEKRGNGLGSDWNVSWSAWVAGSALN